MQARTNWGFRHRRRVATSSGVALVSHTKGGAASTYTTPAMDSTGATFKVLGISYSLATGFPTLSDSKGNTDTPLTATFSGGSADSRLAYCASPTVGASHTETVTGASEFSAVCVAAFSGVLGAAPLRVEGAGAFTTGTTIQPGSVTPAVGDLVIAHLDYETAQVVTINSGFTIIDQVNQSGGVNFGSALAYFVSPDGAAINPTWALPSGGTCAAVISVFKHA